ncbi:zf-TFIIB domain-containing protein [bacterium]|nr:zf-TFIIB domain-containing protein [bacterium]
MNCPICNINLNPIVCENQEIDLCKKCGGVWFDKGELLKVVNSLLNKNKVDPQTVIESYSKKVIDSNKVKQLVRKCPRCLTDMQIYNYSYDSNIFLDKCCKCNGIWADKGEMQAVAKHLKGNPMMNNYAHSLIKECTKLQESKSNKGKIIAVIIFLFYLGILFFNNASLRLFQTSIFLIFSLACIFYGKELGRTLGVRYRALPFALVLTKPIPGVAVIFMGWLLMIFTIIFGMLTVFGAFN